MLRYQRLCRLVPRTSRFQTLEPRTTYCVSILENTVCLHLVFLLPHSHSTRRACVLDEFANSPGGGRRLLLHNHCILVDYLLRRLRLSRRHDNSGCPSRHKLRRSAHGTYRSSDPRFETTMPSNFFASHSFCFPTARSAVLVFNAPGNPKSCAV